MVWKIQQLYYLYNMFTFWRSTQWCLRTNAARRQFLLAGKVGRFLVRFLRLTIWFGFRAQTLRFTPKDPTWLELQVLRNSQSSLYGKGLSICLCSWCWPNFTPREKGTLGDLELKFASSFRSCCWSFCTSRLLSLRRRRNRRRKRITPPHLHLSHVRQTRLKRLLPVCGKRVRLEFERQSWGRENFCNQYRFCLFLILK